MVDECLTKPCLLCSKKITGANWFCPDCKICVCFTCGINMKELECSECGRKLV